MLIFEQHPEAGGGGGGHVNDGGTHETFWKEP